MAWAASCNLSPLTPTPSSSSPLSPFPQQHQRSHVSIPQPSSSEPFPSSSIHNPSSGVANAMWFKGAYNAQIFVGEEEPPESMLRRFRKAVSESGVIPEVRRRRFFETSQDVKKRKTRSAASKRKARRFIPRAEFDKKRQPSKPESAGDDEDGDYWEYAAEGVEVDYKGL